MVRRRRTRHNQKCFSAKLRACDVTPSKPPNVPRGTLLADRRAKNAHDLGATVGQHNRLTALVLRCGPDRRAKICVRYPPLAPVHLILFKPSLWITLRVLTQNSRALPTRIPPETVKLRLRPVTLFSGYNNCASRWRMCAMLRYSKACFRVPKHGTHTPARGSVVGCDAFVLESMLWSTKAWHTCITLTGFRVFLNRPQGSPHVP